MQTKEKSKNDSRKNYKNSIAAVTSTPTFKKVAEAVSGLVNTRASSIGVLLKGYRPYLSGSLIFGELEKDYLHADVLKTRVENVLSTLSYNDLRILLTYESLGSKIKSVTPEKEKEEHIQEFKETQKVPNLNMKFFTQIMNEVRPVFESYLPTDFSKFTPESVFKLGEPIYITSGASFPRKTFPNIFRYKEPENRLETKLRRLLLLVEDGVDDAHALKLAFVPKNYKGYRTIAIPNREAVAIQIPLNNVLREKLVRLSDSYNGCHANKHIISFNDQSINQSIIMDVSTASVDLSSASDRVYRSIIEQLSPELVRLVEKTLPSDFFIETMSDSVRLNSIGAQGLPLTFTIMSLLVHSIAKTYTTQSAVYGDDLIVNIEEFGITKILENFGLIVNSNKSFALPGFAESCGVHRYIGFDGVARDITPVYLRNLDTEAIISFLTGLSVRKIIPLSTVIKLAKRVLPKFVITPFEADGCIYAPDATSVYTNIDIELRSLYQSRHLKVPTISYKLEQVDGFSRQQSIHIISAMEYREFFKNPFPPSVTLPSGEVIEDQPPELTPLASFALGLGARPIFKDNSERKLSRKTIAYIKILTGFGHFFKRGTTPSEYGSVRSIGDIAVSHKLRFNIGSYAAQASFTWVNIWDFPLVELK